MQGCKHNLTMSQRPVSNFSRGVYIAIQSAIREKAANAAAAANPAAADPAAAVAVELIDMATIALAGVDAAAANFAAAAASNSDDFPAAVTPQVPFGLAFGIASRPIVNIHLPADNHPIVDAPRSARTGILLVSDIQLLSEMVERARAPRMHDPRKTLKAQGSITPRAPVDLWNVNNPSIYWNQLHILMHDIFEDHVFTHGSDKLCKTHGTPGPCDLDPFTLNDPVGGFDTLKEALNTVFSGITKGDRLVALVYFMQAFAPRCCELNRKHNCELTKCPLRVRWEQICWRVCAFLLRYQFNSHRSTSTFARANYRTMVGNNDITWMKESISLMYLFTQGGNIELELPVMLASIRIRSQPIDPTLGMTILRCCGLVTRVDYPMRQLDGSVTVFELESFDTSGSRWNIAHGASLFMRRLLHLTLRQKLVIAFCKQSAMTFEQFVAHHMPEVFHGTILCFDIRNVAARAQYNSVASRGISLTDRTWMDFVINVVTKVDAALMGGLSARAIMLATVPPNAPVITKFLMVRATSRHADWVSLQMLFLSQHMLCGNTLPARAQLTIDAATACLGMHALGHFEHPSVKGSLTFIRIAACEYVRIMQMLDPRVVRLLIRMKVSVVRGQTITKFVCKWAACYVAKNDRKFCRNVITVLSALVRRYAKITGAHARNKPLNSAARDVIKQIIKLVRRFPSASMPDGSFADVDPIFRGINIPMPARVADVDEVKIPAVASADEVKMPAVDMSGSPASALRSASFAARPGQSAASALQLPRGVHMLPPPLPSQAPPALPVQASAARPVHVSSAMFQQPAPLMRLISDECVQTGSATATGRIRVKRRSKASRAKRRRSSTSGEPRAKRRKQVRKPKKD